MKYQQLLSRIGACIDRLVGIGFKHELKSNELNLNSLVSLYNKQHYHIIFWHEGVAFRGEWIEYTDNFEQELFDKLKELL